MSDTFNHEGDAWDSYDQAQEDGYSSKVSKQDPLHYHTKHKIESVLASTDKAYLFVIDGEKYWVPRSLCRYLTDYSVYIWDKFEFHSVGAMEG